MTRGTIIQQTLRLARARNAFVGVALMIGVAPAAAAQDTPGRDLLRFPLGTLDRPSALPTGLGDGLGNPATLVMGGTEFLRAGVAALQTPSEQGVSAHLLAVSMRLPKRLTGGLSVALLGVRDIFRTETDPQTLGAPVAYGTLLTSATVAARSRRHVAGGVALRVRRGQLDQTRGTTIGLDGGVLIDSLPYHDATLGASTFLWTPGNTTDEGPTLHLAADLRVWGKAPEREVRGGLAAVLGPGGADEEFLFTAVRRGAFEGRAGAVRVHSHEAQSWRPRLGLTVYYGQYRIGIAREENGADLGPLYQFTLAATLHR